MFVLIEKDGFLKNRGWIDYLILGMILGVSLEDIKSPLPARRVLSKDENGDVSEQPTVIQQSETVKQPIVTAPIPEKKKNKKTLIFVILGIILAIFIILFLTTSKKTTNTGQVTLIYWGLWEDESVMNGVIADFESKNPNIKIEYRKKIKEGYRGLLAGRLAKSGSEVEVPDIFRIHNTHIPMFRDYLASVPTKVVTNIGLDTDFFDVYKTDLKENGVWLSIPLMYDGLVMFYNPELLNKAGVEVPKDWWNLKKAAIKITEKEGNEKIKVAGAALGSIDNVDHWSDIVGLMTKQNGVNFKNIQTTESTSKLKDVFNFYTLFKTSDKVWNDTLPNSTQFFASGNLGFYFGPSWRIFDIQALNPSLKFEIASIPQLPTTTTSTEKIDAGSELTNIYWASYWTEGVNNKSKNQDEAWKFLEYLSSVEGLEKMYEAASQTRSFGQIYPRKSMVDKISSNSKLKPFVESANYANSWYLASSTNDDGLNTQMQKYFSDAIGTILKNSSESDEAMTTLVNGIVQLQQKYRLVR